MEKPGKTCELEVCGHVVKDARKRFHSDKCRLIAWALGEYEKMKTKRRGHDERS